MTVTRLLARPLLASTFIVGGVHALRNADALAAKARPVTDKVAPAAAKAAPQVPVPQDAKTLVRINAGVQVVAGLALATNRQPRLAATLLAATLVPTTAVGHRFWEESDPTEKRHEMALFFKNVSLFGGTLLAAVDTDGKPGLAWRAQHGAGQARREVRRAAKSAKREAKLARAQVG
ncbi:MAG: DoxX family membrane protein [Nocardioides sp.]|nr:DoxX family membrane protein [Nocardioides sp.]